MREPADGERSHAFSILAPGSALLVSFMIAAGCVLLPASVYERIILEPNRLHLNPEVVLFVTLCCLAFAFGLWMAAQFRTLMHKNTADPLAKARLWWVGVPATTVGIVVAVLLVANIYMLAMIARSFDMMSFVLTLALEQRSHSTTEQVLGVFGAGNYWIPTFTPSVVCLGYWTWAMLSGGTRPALCRFVKWATIALGLISAVILLLTLKRSPIAMLIFNVLAVHFLILHYRRQFSFRRFLRYVVPLLFVGIAFFSVMQAARTVGITTKVVGKDAQSALMGYYAGSYNRLAFLIDGDLNLGSPGGYYWTWPVWEFAGVSSQLDLDHTADRLFFNRPVSGATDRSDHIWAAGLRGHFTAITAFGMSFVDFGWLGFLPFVPYGVFAGLLWSSFRTGGYWGVMLYPGILWTILELRGYLNIVRERTVGPILFALAVWGIIAGWKLLDHTSIRSGVPRTSKETA